MRTHQSRERRRVLLTSTVIAGLAWTGAAMAQDGQDEAVRVDEIIVTANRVEQSLGRVPMSVQALTNEHLEVQGVRDVRDLVEVTPGVRFTEGANGQNSISVRGISSGSGAATTGIYIDDLPIQARGLGFTAGNFTPTIFDLQRVEVLRGPQGTLFGDSSMGGAIRFITPQPNLHDYTGYARGEVSTIRGGDLSYEGGLAVGGPLVEGVLGFRASAYFRHAGGWVDRMAGNVTTLSPDGSAGPMGSVRFDNLVMVKENSNSVESSSFRLALAWQPNDKVRVTPSVHYERRENADGDASYWPVLSDPGASRFVRPIWRPTVDANHTPLPNDAPRFQSGVDRFVIPSLQVEIDTPLFNIVSTTALFDRQGNRFGDHTMTYSNLYSLARIPLPGDYTYTTNQNAQEVFTQEVRLQSVDRDARLTWVAGVFYSTNYQLSEQVVRSNMVMSNVAAPAVNGGAPFGPGYSAYMNYYGVEPVDAISYHHYLEATTDQLALFGQIDYALTDRLNLTVGVRASDVTVGYEAEYAGPNSNQNQPRGLACVPGTGRSGVPCSPVAIGQYRPGEGPFTTSYAVTSNSGDEQPVTPKVSLSYQHDDANMFYATWAKGFRAGGAQARAPGTCHDELVGLGFANGVSPESYESDSVTSYELGAKNRLFNRTLNVEVAVFRIEWEGIQTNTNLSSCGISFIRNGSGATSQGVDLSLTWRPTQDLTLGFMVGYQDATRNEDDVSSSGTILAGGGAPIGGPPMQVALNGNYDFLLPNGLPGYIRADYQYVSEGPERDTRATSFDSMIPRMPESHLLNGRIGVYLGDVNFYVFGRNLMNGHETTSLGRTRGRPLYTATAPQPRTVGIGASYRF